MQLSWRLLMKNNEPEIHKLSEDLEEDIKAVFSNYIIPNEKNLKIYHYTTLKALKGIIENNQLWLTNTMYQNDRYESYDYVNQSIETFNNLDFGNKENYINELIKNYEHNNLKNKEYNYMKYDNPNLAHKNASHFVFSTCNKKNYIPMWNYYSENCGVCIEFDQSELANFFKEAIGEKNKEDIPFGCYICIYDNNKKQELIKQCLELSQKEMNNEEKWYYIKYWNTMLTYAYIFKDDDFKYELETKTVRPGDRRQVVIDSMVRHYQSLNLNLPQITKDL